MDGWQLFCEFLEECFYPCHDFIPPIKVTRENSGETGSMEFLLAIILIPHFPDLYPVIEKSASELGPNPWEFDLVVLGWGLCISVILMLNVTLNSDCNVESSEPHRVRDHYLELE